MSSRYRFVMWPIAFGINGYCDGHLLFASQSVYCLMAKRISRPRRSSCPVATSLDIFGDRWTLLIIRDLLFTDNRRFSDFARAGEAIATNVLTDRLELLECEGLILRRPDPADGRKFVYDLTAKGFDLA